MIALLIPESILFDKNLNPIEKIVLSLVSVLDNNDGCYANNNYFSKIINRSQISVSRIINVLIKKGYVESQIITEKGNKRFLKLSSKMRIAIIENEKGYTQKRQEGILKNDKHKYNNKLNKNINRYNIEKNKNYYEKF